MSARAAYHERRAITERIDWEMLPTVPPLQPSPHLSRQVKLWKKLIAHEQSNPQHLNPATLRKRVTLAYNQVGLIPLIPPPLS